MKKSIYLFSLAVIVVAACSKEIVPSKSSSGGDKNLVELTFTANAEDLIARSALNPDRSVSFSAGDKISVFCNGTNYQFTTTEGGATATFTGTGEVASKYYALYPYTSSATIDGAGVISSLSITTGTPNTPTGSFASQKAFAVAVTTGSSFVFKNVCALLKFTVPAEVTDLKQVIVFACNQSGNSDAITGSFTIDTKDGGVPVVSITSASYQTGFAGPDGTGSAIPAGDYYMPVLPASLTKGINVKCNYLDSYVSRGFNGSVIALEAGKVYDLGSVKKTHEFVYASFESNSISDDIRDGDGNLAKISVVANSFNSAENSSSYILKDDHSSTSGATSGLIKVDMSSALGKVKFPYAVRDKFNKVQVKVYIGSNAYVPRFDWNYSNAVRPSRINGVAVDSQSTWETEVRTDDWNVLEWDASAFSKTNFSSLDKFGLRMFVDYGGTNLAKSATSDHIAYVDDIKFFVYQ